jgi:hypothetical protein
VVEEGTDWQRTHVGSHSRNGEHQVQPDLLRKADVNISVQLVLCAEIPINAFLDQNRLESSISKDDSGREEAVYHSEEDLD